MCHSRLAKTLIAALLAAAASIASAQALKLSHVRPQGSTADTDVRALADALAKSSSLKIDIFPANALGDYTVVQERISVGAIDMALQPAATSGDRRMQIGVFPYLANDWAGARKAFGKGSPLRAAMEDMFAKQDIKVLAAYPMYFGGIALNKAPVSPGDPNAAKGLKLRVPPIKSFQLAGNAMGYISAPLPFSEAFTAVQTGVVDGVLGSGAEGYYASFRDVTKHYIVANTHFELWYLLMNKTRYDGLKPADRAALDKAAAEFETQRWGKAEADQADNEKKLEQAGAKIVRLSNAELAATAAKVRKTVWPEIIKDVGEGFAKPILDKVAN
jgi:TRAP-type C4-dicarboxylate transport system substrate-binding protein